MAYQKQTWGNTSSTPLSATRLNKLETQYDSVVADIADATSPVGQALTATFVSVLTSNGSGDQRARINAALSDAAATGGTVRLVGAFTIGGFVLVPSGVTLDTLDAVVTLAANTGSNMLRLDTRLIRSVTASNDAAGTTLTAAAGTFDTADIGRSVVIPEAGPQTVSTDLGTGTTITNFTAVITAVSGNGSTATLSTGLGLRAKSNATVAIWSRVRDIRLRLGVWDRGASGGSGNDLHSIFLRRGDNVVLESLYYRSTGGKYGVSYGDMVHFQVGRVEGACFSDLIHGIGPLRDVKIDTVIGVSTHDDCCAVGCGDYSAYADISGPVEDWSVGYVQTTSDARAVLVTAGVFSDYTLNAKVGRVLGKTESPLVRVTGSNTKDGAIIVKRVEIDSLDGRPREASPVLSLSANIGEVRVGRIATQAPTGSGSVIRPDAEANIEVLSIGSLAVPAGRDGHAITIDASVRIGRLSIADTDITLSSTAALVFAAGKVETLSLRGVRQSGGRAILVPNGDNRATRLDITDVTSDVPVVRAAAGSHTVVAMVNSLNYLGSSAPFHIAAGTGSIILQAWGNIATNLTNLLTRAGSQVLRALGLNARVDVTTLTPAPGDIVFHTGTGGPGVGPCVYDGATSAWKTLGTSGGAGGTGVPVPGDPVNAVVVSDTFSRTAPSVTGTMPDTGGSAWSGPSTELFAVNGSRLVKGSNLGVSSVRVQAPALGTVKVSGVVRTATDHSASQTTRLFAKWVDDSNALRLQKTGTTSASIALAVVIANSARTIATFPAGTIPASTGYSDYPFEITCATDGTVTATVNGQTVSGALTAGEASTLANARTFAVGSTEPGFEMDNLSYHVNGQYV